MNFYIHGNEECELIIGGGIARKYKIDLLAYEEGQYYLGCLELVLGVKPGLLIHCLYDGEWSFAAASGGFKRLPHQIRFRHVWYEHDPSSQTLHIECPKSASFFRGRGLIVKDETVHQPS